MSRLLYPEIFSLTRPTSLPGAGVSRRGGSLQSTRDHRLFNVSSSFREVPLPSHVGGSFRSGPSLSLPFVTPRATKTSCCTVSGPGAEGPFVVSLRARDTVVVKPRKDDDDENPHRSEVETRWAQVCAEWGLFYVPTSPPTFILPQCPRKVSSTRRLNIDI